MSVRTVRELREWLQDRGGDGERLIQNDWWVWTNASGDICVQHPTCPDMSAVFCCDGTGSSLDQEVSKEFAKHKEVSDVGSANQGRYPGGVQ